MKPKFRIEKILGDMASYRSFGDTPPPLEFFNRVTDDEQLVGVYTNNEQYRIYLSTQRLFLTQADQVVIVPYAEILDTRLPQADKEEIEHIEVTVRDRGRILVHVLNGEGRFRDVFEFARLIKRLTSPARNESPGR